MLEARAPVQTEVMTSNGDTIFMMNSDRKEPKTVIAIRKDLAKQATIRALEMKKWINDIEVITEGASIHIKSAHLPHQTSKVWSEECFQALTPVKDILCGDMNYTPAEDMVEIVWGVTTSQPAEAFKDKWNRTPNRWDGKVAQCWPSIMTRSGHDPVWVGNSCEAPRIPRRGPLDRTGAGRELAGAATSELVGCGSLGPRRCGRLVGTEDV